MSLITLSTINLLGNFLNSKKLDTVDLDYTERYLDKQKCWLHCINWNRLHRILHYPEFSADRNILSDGSGSILSKNDNILNQILHIGNARLTL